MPASWQVQIAILLWFYSFPAPAVECPGPRPLDERRPVSAESRWEFNSREAIPGSDPFLWTQREFEATKCPGLTWGFASSFIPLDRLRLSGDLSYPLWHKPGSSRPF
jgi:hypothetical protein